MKQIVYEARRAVLATLVLAFVCCAVYPLVVFGIAQARLSHPGEWQFDRGRLRHRSRFKAARAAILG